eukprot:9472892-Pyramimonas_sp.AAC.2
MLQGLRGWRAGRFAPREARMTSRSRAAPPRGEEGAEGADYISPSTGCSGLRPLPGAPGPRTTPTTAGFATSRVASATRRGGAQPFREVATPTRGPQA